MFTQTSFREPALSSASQAGLVNNLNDGLAWGLFPALFAAVLAHDAVRILTAHGRRARRVTDGVLEWRVAGLPVWASAA